MTSQPPPDPYGQQPPDPYGQSTPPPSSGPPQYPPPGPPGQPGYPPPPPGPGAGTNIMAILALVFAFVFAPAGIVLGHVARRQIRRTGEAGDGLALAGLIISYILTALYVLACCGIIALAITADTTTTT